MRRFGVQSRPRKIPAQIKNAGNNRICRLLICAKEKSMARIFVPSLACLFPKVNKRMRNNSMVLGRSRRTLRILRATGDARRRIDARCPKVIFDCCVPAI